MYFIYYSFVRLLLLNAYCAEDVSFNAREKKMSRFDDTEFENYL